MSGMQQLVGAATRPARRHCMVVHSDYPLGETRVQREAQALIDRGIDVDIICLRQPGEARIEQVAGATIYRLPVRRDKRRGLAAQLLEYLTFAALAFLTLTALHLRRRYQVVQVHNLPDFLVFAALVPRLTGSKIILDLHDLMPEFFAARFGSSRSSLPLRLVRLQERLSCRFADHVITVSEHWRQALIARGVPASKCSVLMNLADGRIFTPQQRRAADRRFRLIYHGTITRRYGLDVLLRAVSLARARVPDIEVRIIGAGEYVDALRQLVQELGLGDHVQIGDVVPAEQLPTLICQADLGVVPYRGDAFTDELLPTKLMEYAALGVPAIVSRTRAIATCFDDTMVQFVTPGDPEDLARSIEALYHDRERLLALGAGIQRFNQRYSWASQAESYARVVDGLARP
jgi:glycosyltransferase involved in cell wall biosynthesis